MHHLLSEIPLDEKWPALFEMFWQDKNVTLPKDPSLEAIQKLRYPWGLDLRHFSLIYFTNKKDE